MTSNQRNPRPFIYVKEERNDPAVARALLEGKPQPPGQHTDKFSLETLADRWKLRGVKGIEGYVELGNALLDNGNTRTQNQWADYTIKARKKNELGTPSYDTCWSIFETLYDNREGKHKDEIEKIRGFLEGAFKRYLVTLTRVRYTPNQNDAVIHDYGMSEQREIKVETVGPDEYVKDSTRKEIYKALLGTDDTAKIDEVFKWITGKNIYLYRVNSEPKNVDERVAWFGAGSGRAGLYCYRDPLYSIASLGVSVRAEGAPKI